MRGVSLATHKVFVGPMAGSLMFGVLCISTRDMCGTRCTHVSGGVKPYNIIGYWCYFLVC
jgi:hypothetical protein